MKRFLNCNASDFEKMTKSELIESIAASEGRIVVCETIGAVPQMLGDVTNAEFAASMGADIILLNIFDVNNPVMHGLPADVKPEDYIRKIKELTGRPVGLNLEPLEEGVASTVETDEWAGLSSGRAGTLENAKKAVEMGADFIVLTGNPGIGVTNKAKMCIRDRNYMLFFICVKLNEKGCYNSFASKAIFASNYKISCNNLQTAHNFEMCYSNSVSRRSLEQEIL